MLQHAAAAQDLFRDVLKPTADFARSTHSTALAGSGLLGLLAMATSVSGRAAPHFAETAECALALPRSSHPADRTYPKDSPYDWLVCLAPKSTAYERIKVTK
ncbi:hypothetical protein [Streptomyces physcomitrii]|uniref:Uncharacterized protein n=1 Tax=Streptomyces physcomitrii TaxID=2724184 RepID=A0ABX1HDH8_9ACTN|nr:hypothetical protein [Streptomyces physcomitrii]NKI45274.1 hypothetical protein [Streptomyces physcomitrii]